jgi:UDPglucose 6-dehydrogenase
VRAHDPEAGPNFVRSYGVDVQLFGDEYEAATGADLLVLMTEWRHLRNPDFDRLKTLLRSPAVFDARNIWTTFELESKGFRYRGVGTHASTARGRR